LKSTTHRVQIPPRQRFSIAYFVQADPDTVLFSPYKSDNSH
jgi:isopenicillin N synthase-like dioxygenase